jgi:AcrR family transcriptional regulator
MTLLEPVEPRLRRDAARNRERVLIAGRAALDSGETLQLNEIARIAGVGVGTVYRHFPSTADLLESLVAEKLQNLLAEARSATSQENAWDALTGFIVVSATMQARDSAFATVMASTTDVLPTTTTLKSSLSRLFERLIERARDAGAIRPEFYARELRHMVSGLAYSIRLGGNEKPTSSIYFESFFRSIKA